MPEITRNSGDEEASAGTDIVLRDGSTVRVRRARAADAPALFEFLSNLSGDSLALRFAGSMSRQALERQAREMADGGIGEDEALALVASVGDERIVGHALYAGTGDGRAEVAFLVADHLHGQGLGSTLLGQLAHIASARGIEVFEASVARCWQARRAWRTRST